MIHPALGYAEALGAVLGTLPHLHMDVAAALVEQVTPRPAPEPPVKVRRGGLIAARMALAAVIAGLAVFHFGASPAPASASAPFGPIWQAGTQMIGLTCYGEGPGHVCRDSSGHGFTAEGFRHQTGSLYVFTGPTEILMFVFDEAEDAATYAARHPGVRVAGRVAVL